MLSLGRPATSNGSSVHALHSMDVQVGFGQPESVSWCHGDESMNFTLHTSFTFTNSHRTCGTLAGHHDVICYYTWTSSSHGGTAEFLLESNLLPRLSGKSLVHCSWISVVAVQWTDSASGFSSLGVTNTVLLAPEDPPIWAKSRLVLCTVLELVKFEADGACQWITGKSSWFANDVVLQLGAGIIVILISTPPAFAQFTTQLESHDDLASATAMELAPTTESRLPASWTSFPRVGSES